MPKQRSHTAITIVLLLAAATYTLFIGRTAFRAEGRPFYTLIDDAMISMRYAQHLAMGQGLVWNVGEAPIQGFTSPGWVLVMAVPHLLGVSPVGISLSLMIVAAVMLLLNILVVYRISLEISPTGAVAPVLAAAITAFYFPLVFWSLRGMEVGALVLLMDLALLAALQIRLGARSPALGLALLLACALLIRLDAALQVAMIMAYLWIARPISRRQLLMIGAIVAMTLAGILLLQHAYFGDALPNTYYQKMIGGPLDERVRHGVLMFYQYTLPELAAMVMLSVGLLCFPQLRSARTVVLAGLFLVQCGYSVWVGGDYAEPEVASANRFITQGVPALIVLLALVLGRVIEGRPPAGRRARLVLPMALLLGLATLGIVSGPAWFRWVENNAPLLQSDIRRARAGLAIAQFTAADAVIAVHAAGQIPYYSERGSIDLLGLNDAVIARGPRRTSFYPGHDKWDYDYSIGQLQPDLIADNWIRLADYMRTRPEYRKLTNGMYVRADTTRVDAAGLQEAFP